MSMSEKIEFYYNPMSRGRMVHWMLEEAEAPYEIKKLDWQNADHKKPEYLKLNPMGKVPTIVHKGVVVTECAAICAYLADAFPKNKLAPPTHDPKRGTYYRWLFFTAGCVEAAILSQKFPFARPANKGTIGWGSYEDTMRTMEIAVSNGFVAGDRFSAADVYLASQIQWGLYMNDIPAKPVFKNYVALCTDRPGYHRYMEQAGPF